MTAREKLKLEHPEKIDPKELGGCRSCPSAYDYLENPSWCRYLDGHNYTMEEAEDECTRCWNREIPESIEKKLARICEVKPDKVDLQMISNMNKREVTMNTRATKQELLENIAKLKEELERLDKYRKYEEAASEIKAIHDAFMNAGFTDEQAFALINTAMSTVKI